MNTRTHAQIEQFLSQHPTQPLWVVVGFASAFGFRWLHERTAGRAVRVLVGDTRKGFANVSADDRQAAIDFINRADTEVLNWYRRHGGYRTVHTKAWLTVPPGASTASAALVGSANLTRQGLYENTETMVAATEPDLRRLRAEMEEAMDKAWPADDSIMRRLGGPTWHRLPSQRRPRPAAAAPPSGAGPPPPPSRDSWPREPHRRERPPRRRWPVVVGASVALLIGAQACRALISNSNAGDPVTDRTVPAVQPSPVPTGAASPAPTEPAPTEPAVTEPAVTEPVPTEPVPTEHIAEDTPTGNDSQQPPAAAPASCPYLTRQGTDACELLESLHGTALTPCEALPVEARPLRLSGTSNPASYQISGPRSDMACAWSASGVYTAGETIPAGDLRSLSPSGECRFTLNLDGGDRQITDTDYRPGWDTALLVRLRPNDMIDTRGCIWVPASAAGLSEEQALSDTHGRFPVLVGTDVAAGVVRIECPFRSWANPMAADNANWAEALSSETATLRPAGPYGASAGEVLWLDCPEPSEGSPQPTDPPTAIAVTPASLPQQPFDTAQMFTLQAVNHAQQSAALPAGSRQPSYELTLAYYETVGPVGLRCRYHEQAAYVDRCYSSERYFLPPSVLTLATDGTATFRLVCHDPAPDTAGNAHTYTWQLAPIDDAPIPWPSQGQITCTDTQ